MVKINKKAWIRILEATVAVLIVASVLIVIYSAQPKRVNISEEISDLQNKILRDIASNNTLRSEIIVEEYSGINSYAEEKLPAYFNFSLRICDLGGSCVLNENIFKTIADKEIFVEEIIISGNLTLYTPKKVRLFTWIK